MNCQELKNLYDPTSRPPTELAGHLTGCADCRTYVGDMQRLRELLASAYSEVAVPRDFDHRLRERLDRAKGRPWWSRMSAWSLPIAATAMVVLAVSVALFRVQEQPKETAISMTEYRASQPVAGAPMLDAAEETPATPEADAVTMTGDNAVLRSDGPAATDRDEFEILVEGTDALTLDSDRPVILIIQDEKNKLEKVVTIPTMLVGGQPLTPVEVSKNEAATIY
jgi:hypothetical protein